MPLLLEIVSNPDEDLRLRQEAINTLGKIGDPQAIPTLVDALEDPEAGIRWRAAMALARIGDPSVIPAIEEALAQEKDTFVIEQMEEALQRLSETR